MDKIKDEEEKLWDIETEIINFMKFDTGGKFCKTKAN